MIAKLAAAPAGDDTRTLMQLLLIGLEQAEQQWQADKAE